KRHPGKRRCRFVRRLNRANDFVTELWIAREHLEQLLTARGFTDEKRATKTEPPLAKSSNDASYDQSRQRNTDRDEHQVQQQHLYTVAARIAGRCEDEKDDEDADEP